MDFNHLSHGDSCKLFYFSIPLDEFGQKLQKITDFLCGPDLQALWGFTTEKPGEPVYSARG
jgi:hypothetical protein